MFILIVSPHFHVRCCHGGLRRQRLRYNFGDLPYLGPQTLAQPILHFSSPLSCSFYSPTSGHFLTCESCIENIKGWLWVSLEWPQGSMVTVFPCLVIQPLPLMWTLRVEPFPHLDICCQLIHSKAPTKVITQPSSTPTIPHSVLPISAYCQPPHSTTSLNTIPCFSRSVPSTTSTSTSHLDTLLNPFKWDCFLMIPTTTPLH